MGKNLTLCAVIGLLLSPLALPTLAEDGTEPQPKLEPTGASVPGADQLPLTGVDALAKASTNGKYAFLFFYRNEDVRTEQLRTVFKGAVAKITGRAESLIIRVDDPLEKEIVDRFEVGAAPMPFVLAVASNGAVIHSYKLAFSEQQLMDSFASPGMEKTLKALQDGKMTFVCVQNDSTKYNAKAMKGVNEFKSDPKYAEATEVVTIDPGDAAEAEFLKNLKVDLKTKKAVTVLLAPPGTTVATYKGATKKRTLLAAVKKATENKPCCPGKKGGCAPKKKGK